MMEEILVSIVVPVYKVQNYICQCIDSLVNQTYKNLEIVLVDDESPDKCGEICDRYANSDSRISVIHKKNGGLSSAREAGITAASGDYIMIVDGDDWIDNDTIEACVNRVKKNPDVDCVLFSYVKEFPENAVPMHVMDGDEYLSPEEAEERVYRRLFGLVGSELKHPERMDNIVSCCMKLYKADIAKKGRYFDNRIVGSSEDTLFNMYALHKCGSVEYLDKCFYHYRKVETSHTSTYRSALDKKWAILFNHMQDVICEKNLSEKYEEALSNRIALSITGIGMNELNNRNVGVQSRFQAVRKYLLSNEYQKNCKNIPIKPMPLIWKVFFVCCKCRFSIAVYFMLWAMTWLRRR